MSLTKSTNEVLSLAEGVRLRREYFGGLAFDTRNGNIIELDKEAFALAIILGQGKISKQYLKKILIENNLVRGINNRFGSVLKSLINSGIINTENTPASVIQQNQGHDIRSIQLLKEKIPYPWLSAPETVHWAVTYRCRKDCPECYTRQFLVCMQETFLLITCRMYGINQEC